MRNNIIRGFEEFKAINEEQTLFSFLTGQIGGQVEKAVKEKIVIMVAEYFGIPMESENPITNFIRDVIVKLIADLPPSDMDDFLLGRRAINDRKYWSPKIAKAFQEALMDQVSSYRVLEFMGLDKNSLFGRLVSNVYRSTIEDVDKIQEALEGAWNLVATNEFIPSKKASEIYDEALDKLTPAQRAQAEKSVWGGSMRQVSRIKAD
jgi:hypothetical protein